MDDKRKDWHDDENELEPLGVRPSDTWLWADWIGRFLNQPQPALLPMIAAMVLVLAGFLAYLSMQTGGYIAQHAVGAGGIRIIWRALSVVAFLSGVIGSLLPMWAVGRLIADAILEGNKS